MKISNKIQIWVFSFVFMFSVSLKGQEVSDFTIVSEDGIEYTLYDYLDAGIPVVLDMFARY